MNRIFIALSTAFLLSACKPLQRSPLFTIEEAEPVLGLNVPYDLQYSFNKGLNYEELTIKADKARFLPSNIIGAREHRICPTATGKCRVEIFRVLEGDSTLIGFSEYKVIEPELEANLGGKTGAIQLTRGELLKLRGIGVRFSNADFDSPIRIVNFELQTTIRGKKVSKRVRGNRWSAEVQTILNYKGLKTFKITNIQATYGCINERHSLEDLQVEVIDWTLNRSILPLIDKIVPVIEKNFD